MLALIAMFFLGNVYARSHGSIELGEPRLVGDGCLPGTVGQAMTEDESEISLLFDDYRAETPPGIAMHSKSCAVYLPIQVREGKQIEIFKVDYRGYNQLPKGSQSEFLTQYQFVGASSPGKTRSKVFREKDSGEFYESSIERVTSRCGGANVLELKTRIILNNPLKQAYAVSEIDTADLSTPHRKVDRKVKFKIKILKCKKDR